MAGGFSDAQTFLSHPENWSLHWAIITEYLTSLFNAHTQQAMPLPEKIAFGLAVIFGARHVLVKAFYALKRLCADMNLLMMGAFSHTRVHDCLPGSFTVVALKLGAYIEEFLKQIGANAIYSTASRQFISIRSLSLTTSIPFGNSSACSLSQLSK